jgi:hypothetical protein
MSKTMILTIFSNMAVDAACSDASSANFSGMLMNDFTIKLLAREAKLREAAS